MSKPKEQSFRETHYNHEISTQSLPLWCESCDEEVLVITPLHLLKVIERAKPKMAEPTSGLKRTYNNGIEDYEAAIKESLK